MKEKLRGLPAIAGEEAATRRHYVAQNSAVAPVKKSDLEVLDRLQDGNVADWRHQTMKRLLNCEEEFYDTNPGLSILAWGSSGGELLLQETASQGKRFQETPSQTRESQVVQRSRWIRCNSSPSRTAKDRRWDTLSS